MRWRVYYGDGSTYSDRDGSPYDAVPTGVQAIAQEDGSLRGWGVAHGKDAYYWRADVGWQGCDVGGLWDYLLCHRGAKVVLMGRSIRDAAFWGVVDRAIREGVG